ncbi:MAG: hypothetical protein U9O94_11265 [Nanoarchaeota archaeon]|nr:hypothetical protein [Nanoarchaeota archaeon]
MDKVVKTDILFVLSDVIDILKVKEERDTVDLKELSNHTIHNASIFQDEDSVSIAILIYSLSKVIERREGKLNYNSLLSLLKSAKDNLEAGKFDIYRNNIEKIFNFISTVDSKLELYVEEVVGQAQIKKSSKLYDHGISLARASELMGASQWDLMSYIGKTTLTNLGGGVSIKDRLNYTRSLFR